MPVERVRLQVRKISGGVSLTPQGSTTGDDAVLYANVADTYPLIRLYGGQYFVFSFAAGNAMIIREELADLIKFEHSGTDCLVTSGLNNHDLYLAITGSGYVKFGTRTATGDVACNGHLDIKDSAGNVVKLMTTA